MKKLGLTCMLNHISNALNNAHSRWEVVALAIIVATTMWFIGGVIKCLYLLLMLL